MKLSASKSSSCRGSVLIIVLWVSLGVVATALYFAHSMVLELKAADNHVASMEADQAIEGAALYVSNILATRANMMMIPTPSLFHAEAVKVGNAKFWLIGRDTNDLQTSSQGDHPIWGLVDECSRVNLNTATTATNLQNLPQMTENTSAAMYDWQSTNTTASTDGAKSDVYSALNPPYLCKNTNYESPEELRMVYGLNMDFLYGEDANLNGILDPNENDGMNLPPYDNQDGILDPGLLEYVTVWTHESTMGTNGSPRISVANTAGMASFVSSNFPSLSQYFPSGTTSTTGASSRSSAPSTPSTAGAYTSVFQLYVQSGMSESQFQQIEPFLMNPAVVGLINVNTATATALSCIPGIGTTLAPQILAYRQGNPPQTPSITWLKNAITDQSLIASIGPYITPYSWQFTADVAAVGHANRGYRRVRFVFDCSSGTPLIVYRQDLTHLGWALGKKLHDKLLANNL
jgi:type II secretory pathway component PulK